MSRCKRFHNRFNLLFATTKPWISRNQKPNSAYIGHSFFDPAAVNNFPHAKQHTWWPHGTKTTGRQCWQGSAARLTLGYRWFPRRNRFYNNFYRHRCRRHLLVWCLLLFSLFGRFIFKQQGSIQANNTWSFKITAWTFIILLVGEHIKSALANGNNFSNIIILFGAFFRFFLDTRRGLRSEPNTQSDRQMSQFNLAGFTCFAGPTTVVVVVVIVSGKQCHPHGHARFHTTVGPRRYRTHTRARNFSIDFTHGSTQRKHGAVGIAIAHSTVQTQIALAGVGSCAQQTADHSGHWKQKLVKTIRIDWWYWMCLCVFWTLWRLSLASSCRQTKSVVHKNALIRNKVSYNSQVSTAPPAPECKVNPAESAAYLHKPLHNSNSSEM